MKEVLDTMYDLIGECMYIIIMQIFNRKMVLSVVCILSLLENQVLRKCKVSLCKIVDMNAMKAIASGSLVGDMEPRETGPCAGPALNWTNQIAGPVSIFGAGVNRGGRSLRKSGPRHRSKGGPIKRMSANEDPATCAYTRIPCGRANY